MRKPSPTDKDAQRIAERIYLDFGGSIKDERTFKLAYTSYFEGSMTTGIKQLQGDVFRALRQHHPNIEKGDTFKEAEGKNFDADRAHTAKTIVNSPEVYKKKGAANVDLRGYDTKGAAKQFTKLKHRYSLIGTVRGRTVRAARQTITIRGKPTHILRDARGRFVKKS